MLNGPRTCVPPELESWVGKPGPFPGGGTTHLMEMHRFGVQGEISIDPRCPAEQVILRKPGNPEARRSRPVDMGRYGTDTG